MTEHPAIAGVAPHLEAIASDTAAIANREIELLSIADLATLPEPSWLVEDLLPAAGFSVLFGPSGTGKSFLALDWSLCVAAGLQWYGQDVNRGGVVYIAAEGVAGLYRRISAWLHARHQDAPDTIRFLGSAINFLEPVQLQRAKTAIGQLDQAPALIVVDTMARSMTGGDENAARDVGQFIHAVDQLRAAHGAAALIVHHTGKDGEDERGSSALRAAADAMLALKPDGASLRLDSVKAKDSEPFEPWKLHLRSTLESCVIGCGTRTGVLAPSEVQILERVSAAFGTHWATGTAFRDAAGATKSTYHRSLKALLDAELVAAEDDSRRPRYRVTDDGLARVSSSPTESHGTRPASPTQSPLYGTVGLGPETNAREQAP